MKKRWVFALAVAALLPAGVLCRIWQRWAAFEESGLLTPGHPSTVCLMVVLALAAAGFLALGRWCAKGELPPGYLASFALPRRGLLAVYVLSGALLVAAGALGLWRWSQGEELGLSEICLSAGLLPTGVSVGLVGWLGAQRGEAKGRFAWPLLLPGYCGCLWLIVIYQARATEPTVMGYAFAFLGAVCAVICCYAMAAFSFERPMPALAVWLGGVALVALGVSLVDATWAGDRTEQLVSAGYLLYVAAQAWCLLKRRDDPAELEAWTPPQENETRDATIEVSDHEE